MPGAHSFDVLIVGAGPAGMAAALAASQGGANVGVVDGNAAAGGQIWRGDGRRLAGGELLTSTRVVATGGPGRLCTDSGGELAYRKLILCTGARERFLPFPGWTLPGVMGAGGLQAMAKGGLPVAGKRVVVAGSGPLSMAVAACLRGRGARIEMIAEQAPRAKLQGFARAVLRQPSKAVQGLGLAWRMGVTKYRTSAWPVRAEGAGKVESVVLRVNGRERRIACDYLACGFGLVPNTELSELLGCRIDGGAAAIDRWQQTSAPGIYCAGEATGIAGVDAAEIEGRIAGHAATGATAKAEALFAARDRANRFRRAMERAFTLRGELAHLATPDTIVCRCEGVTLGQVAEQRSWRSAKLQTRCGMGPCQGRVCGPAVEFLLGWPAESVRSPLFPVRAGTLGSGHPE